MFRYITLCCLLMSAASVQAQKNLKKATLVTTAGQSLQGVINDREWFSNPATIDFKADGSSSFKKYAATEAVSVQIEGGSRYFSKTVTIDKTNDRRLEVDNVLDSSYTSFKKVTIFLLAEVLSDKMNLYSVIDDKLHLFTEKPGGQPEELIHRQYKLRRNGNVYEEEDRTFADQLAVRFADCPDVAQTVFDTKFSVQDIAKEVKRYIACGKAAPVYEKAVRKGILSFGVLAGTAFNSFRFVQKGANSTNVNVVYDTRFTSKMPITAGVRLQYTVPGRQQRLSLVSDIFYTRYAGNTEKQVTYVSPVLYTNRKVNIEFSMLRADVLFRYAAVSKNNFSLFLNAGPGFTKPMGDKSTTVDTEVFNGTTTTTTRNTFEASGGLRGGFINITGGVGAAFRQFSLEYRLFTTGRFAKGSAYAVDWLSHQFLFCYSFK